MGKVTTTKALSVLLRDFRKGKGLNQSELANLAGGIKQATVSHFENNPGPAKVETFLKLVNALDLEIHLVEKKLPETKKGDFW